MRRFQLFHCWLPAQEEESNGGRLLALCGAIRADLYGLGQPSPRLTIMDYEAEIVGKLKAAWAEIESFSGSKHEPDVKAAVAAASEGLMTEEEALRLLRMAWRSWRLGLTL